MFSEAVFSAVFNFLWVANADDHGAGGRQLSLCACHDRNTLDDFPFFAGHYYGSIHSNGNTSLAFRVEKI